MCGICGVISRDLGRQESDLFDSLLRLNSFRGVDSTGIMSIEKPNQKTLNKISRGADYPVRVLKEAVASWSFLSLKTVDQAIRSYSPNKIALVGHTRAATVGEVSNQNAHPFIFPKTIGMVNGTVSKYQIPGNEEFDTDAEAMIALIDEKGEKEALPILTGLTRAPFALVYFNRLDNTLNFIRSESTNESRPLSFIMSEDGKSLIFSSESGMISFAASRLGYKLKKEPSTFFHYKPGQLVKIPLMSERPFKDIRVSTIEKKAQVTSVIYPESSKRTSPFKSDTGISPYVGGDRGFGYDHGNNRPANVPSFLDNSRGSGGAVDWRDYDESDPTAPGVSSEASNILALPARTSNWPVGGASRGIRKDSETASGRDTGKQRVFRGPKGLYVTSDKFHQYCEAGCASCTLPVDPTVENIDLKVAWMKSEGGKAGWEIICEECKDIPFIKENYIDYEPGSKGKDV